MGTQPNHAAACHGIRARIHDAGMDRTAGRLVPARTADPKPPGRRRSGLIGVLVILRPGIADFNPAAILVLLAAFGYAITMITTKQLTATETTFGIVFWMAVIQFPLSLIGSNPAVFMHLDTRHILPAMGVGIAGLTSHYCLSNAFRSGDATLVVPLDFMRIPLIAVVGWAFYGEQLDIFVLLGALIIVAGVLWNLRSEVARAQ